VQAVVVAGGQVLAEKKVEVLVRFTAQSGMKLVPAAVEGLVKQPVEFTVKGSALPGRPRFEWTMGDGSVKNSYEPKISHTYYKEGDFKVTVKLFDGSQVYVGGRKAPVLAECSGSARISKDERLLHYITFWDNEQKRPQQEYYYREGERGQHLKEGDEKRWYENGQLSGRVPWVKGVPNGNIEMFYENGKPQSTGTVINGKINGLGTEYYEEGGKKEEGQIIDDTKVGKWTYWDQYGRIVKTENRNAKGQEHGTTKEWYTVGTADGGRGSIYLGRVIEYVNGESVHITSYREDGSVEREWRK
jgi:antitoxin component YwqK of YwqJK toxin-antitoxin module